MPSRLRKERQGDIVLLTLCHLQRANAVDDRLLVALREAIVEAAEQGARAAVLTGAGGVFCAGYDLHALPANPDPLLDKAVVLMTDGQNTVFYGYQGTSNDNDTTADTISAPYLDVLRQVRDAVDVPVAAYNVSGEYAMLRAAAEKGWLDYKKAVLEALLSFKRAGADGVLTYFALEAGRLLRQR